MASSYHRKYAYNGYSKRKKPQQNIPLIHSDPTSQRWQKLLSYYNSCIVTENSGEITLFSTKEGHDYLRVFSPDKEWVFSGKEMLMFNEKNEKITNFISGPRWSRNPISYYYGYPCYVKQIDKSKAGWTGQVIQPILIFGVDLVHKENGYSFILQPNKPRINSAFLTDKSLQTSIEERKQLIDAVLESWNEENSREQNITEVIKILNDLLPKDILFSKNVVEGEQAQTMEGNGIHAVSVIFKNIDSKYTGGLEQELQELKDFSIPNRVFNIILNRVPDSVQVHNSNHYISITGLNNEQRNVVRSAFNNPISVVTGPPGTGKSQIVLNIIANALLLNQTVLFGSKNHKAVDVVIDRLMRLTTEPVILKYGQKDREIEFAEALLSAIERASGYNYIVLEKEITDLKNKLNIIQEEEEQAHKTLMAILNRRNQINQLEVTLDKIKNEIPKEISPNFNQYVLLNCDSEYFKYYNLLEKLVAEYDKKISFRSRILAVFGLSLEKRIIKASKFLLASFPINNIKEVFNKTIDCRRLLIIGTLTNRWIKYQTQLINLLRANESEKSVEYFRDIITKSKKNAIEDSLRLIDLLMKRRLKVLGPKERQDIADYVGVVRRLQCDTIGGEFADELRKERKRMFSSVAKAFPAIAVTNLSVKHALPLSSDIVDIVVIDEASQCDIASAIPLLYRGKRAVIIGDPNQLTHISLLNRRDDQQLQQQFGLINPDDLRFLYSTISIFELARSVIGNGAKFEHLLEHYRSRSEIINFSNNKFYGGKLSVWTDYSKLKGSSGADAVKWHNVIGDVVRPSLGSAYNLEEAKKVVVVLKEVIDKIPYSEGDLITIGIVTPFKEQVYKIRDLIEKGIDNVLLGRTDIVVETAHKFQGDEKDIMIFSPVVSHNIQQRSLGFLNNTMNLFNVAITRARSELHIVGDRVACAQSGIRYLSEFVNYVDTLKTESIIYNQTKFESPWEEVLFKALASEGIKTLPQYSLNQYRLDLAIIDNELPIDIEIDGEYWHRDIDGGHLFSDLKRDQHLVTHGWVVKRFWVYQLQNNLPQCVEEIKKLVSSKIE